MKRSIIWEVNAAIKCKKSIGLDTIGREGDPLEIVQEI